MAELLTAAEMRAIEQAAIKAGDVTGLELMERAGRAVVEAILAEWPELVATPRRVVVLCGPGNNGGDGFVVARLLKMLGHDVAVLFFATPERLPDDARINHDRWCDAGGKVIPIDPETAMDWDIEAEVIGASLCVDALFGAGLTRPISHIWAVGPSEAIFHGVHLVAVDGLSGLDLDTGRFLCDWTPDDPIRADLTVTFQRPKRGHYLDEGPFRSGKLVVKDIGIESYALRFSQGTLESMMHPQRQRLCWLLGDRRWVSDFREGYGVDVAALTKGDGHKYAHGHALILSGPAGRGGAARLAARGALRIGAGLVTIGCPSGAMAENAARLDAVMLREVAYGAALATVLEDGRINALCLGPGMGAGAREAGLVAAALDASRPPRRGFSSPPPPSREGEGKRAPGKGRPRAIVLDADALTILAREPALFSALHGAAVLTPHAGEFGRLFPDIAARLAEPVPGDRVSSKVDATRAAAARSGCVVLFKGPDTVIAAPDGRCAINAAVHDRAAPWLATAGSGDVLAGFITGLVARGLSPFDAACAAAWLHVECARSFGPGLIAEDLPEELPKVFRGLGMR
ncbi:NAD(P)H-hydrate epimerase [Aliigemmobacter aestuarii]|uniref:Bifunctional NAD(P)H-hydrate repair enzyme n=1 Tax=Aliigemmobacter aestuarii TaxID=1445661 RepID=A0A4V3V0K8_9RHOB|nr:NAD(P)H-hydrate epimerase [Gemmobacter aestuarii]THD84382.1 NAD(P)H-hydrate epimerase [Gemmobacter aestuarii]